MNNQIWQHMTPGRELDVLIAQKANYRIQSFDNGTVIRLIFPNGAVSDPYFHQASELLDWLLLWNRDLIPHYTFSIEAAFTLFDRNPITQTELDWNLFRETFGGYTCELGHWNPEPGGRDWLVSATADSIPMAFVTAWLKWADQDLGPDRVSIEFATPTIGPDRVKELEDWRRRLDEAALGSVLLALPGLTAFNVRERDGYIKGIRQFDFTFWFGAEEVKTAVHASQDLMNDCVLADPLVGVAGSAIRSAQSLRQIRHTQ